MISLQGVETKKVNVKVTKEDLMEGAVDNFNLSDLYTLTRNLLHKEMGVPIYAFIKKGKWFVKEEVGYGNHSYDKEVYIRDVTKRDEEFLSIIKYVYTVKEEQL